MSLLGMLECMKNSWRILVSLRGLHTTPHIIFEISAFLSYMVMHAVHLRLEYGPEEQNALLSLQLTMHSLFLWASHFQEIQLHVLPATVSREISRVFDFEHCHFYLWGTSIHWVTLTCGLCAQSGAEHFKTSWRNLQTSNRQPQKSWGRCPHNKRMLSETLRRLLSSCVLLLLLCNSPSPTTSCLPLPSHSAPRTRSSIQRSKGREFLRWVLYQPRRLSCLYPTLILISYPFHYQRVQYNSCPFS